MSQPLKIIIEDGNDTILIPDAAFQELGVDVCDSVYLIEEYVGSMSSPDPFKNAKATRPY
ncbi:hypothetical protein [Pseudomonas syringae]|uniref:hypothetical protein n=1 Tax=Pseudomonas syringae TaxID=317 RepID=UPI003220924A